MYATNNGVYGGAAKVGVATAFPKNSQASPDFRTSTGLTNHNIMSLAMTKASPAVVVGPYELGTPRSGIVHFSSFDRCIGPLSITLLLVFDKPIDEPVVTIKKALSQALVHYPPMAGRLAATGDDGELHIACTGEGVSFVGASASCALNVTTLASLLGDLAVGYPAEYCRPHDAFLLMQVTEFSCGGFVVGVTWNHFMADAVGMAQFLRAVGELARGMPAPAIVPVRSELDASLPRLPPPLIAAVRSQMRIETEELMSLHLTIASSLISRIKAECGGDCTVFEAVAAVLWRCRTRAIISDGDPDAPAPLAFASNVRGLVGAKEGYYGNCVIVQVIQATSGTVASGDIKDLVKLIKHAKEKVSDILVNGAGSETGAGGGDRQQLAAPRYNTLSISSWRNVGFEAADFGGGRPARVLWSARPTVGFICFVCPPCKGEDGVNVVSRCVKPEHADAFVAELAALNL